MIQSLPSTLSPATMLYVDAVNGRDQSTGDRANPMKTLTQALRRAAPQATIQLLPGTYNVANGEIFPLVIPAGVKVIGDVAARGAGVVIEGNGTYTSATFAQQNVAIVPENNTQLQGVTVTNPVTRGTGVWIESTNAAIARCTFIRCGREGVFITGTATPELVDNLFQQNAASGISVVRNGKGDIRHNIFQRTGYGIAISDQAAPLVTDNQLTANHSGIVLSRSAKPVLRNNTILQNTQNGLFVRERAVPDLGSPASPGGNVLDGNAGFDLVNETPLPILSVGNQLNPTKVEGAVEFGAIASGATLPVPSARTITSVPLTTTAPAPAVVSVAPTPSPSVTVPDDLPDVSGHWAEAFIRALVARGTLSGFPDGSFKPEMTVTRVQYAVAIAATFSLPAKQTARNYIDVGDSFWAAAAIKQVQEMGFLTGFSDGTFRPNQTMKRVEVITSLVDGLELTGGGSVNKYGDRAEIPSYAMAKVTTATQKRLVVNHPDVNRLEPLVDITRAGLAAMVYQALVVTGRAKSLPCAFIVEPDPTAISFSDIQGHWAADFIRGLASQGLIRGFPDGTFKPEALMTRAEYAALLSNAFNPLPDRPAVTFTDVPAAFWAAGVIQRAYRGKWLSGFGNGLFRPQDNVLRLHVLLSLVSGLAVPKGDRTVLDFLSDKASIPAYALDAAASAMEGQMVVNYPDLKTLNPNRPATRAEVTAMVYQALVQTARSPQVNSSYIVRSSLASAVVAPSSGSSSLAGSSPAVTVDPNAPLVVLDPGHGGSDPGTTGIGNLPEKDIVLPVALRTADLLRKKGLRVVLTRDADKDVDSATRVNLAEAAKANVFVSIHANAHSLSRYEMNGLESYYYRTSNEGANLARVIHNQILRKVDLVDSGIRQGSFYTLRATSMPSVLLEVGYVTTALDDHNLIDETYVQNLSDAIADGILEYVRQPATTA
jgi:parallel beta-helix repeat protein